MAQQESAGCCLVGITILCVCGCAFLVVSIFLWVAGSAVTYAKDKEQSASAEEWRRVKEAKREDLIIRSTPFEDDATHAEP